jgi:hypothetical protein
MNDLLTRGPKQIGKITSCLLITLLVCAPVLAQQSATKKPTRKTINDESSDVIQWKYLLASLANDARSLLPEKSRPYALAAVADAYWNLDREIARELFMAALDSAFSPKEDEKVDSSAINQVLAQSLSVM